MGVLYIDKIKIKIDQIKNNPNLDLSERIKKIQGNNNYIMKDCEELALAEIKVEYEFWANNRTNISERTDKMLQSILNGHSLNNIEEFEMMCDDPEKVKKYAMIDTLKQNVSNSNGITLNDFNDLCSRIGFDLEMTNILKSEFAQRDLIVQEYHNSPYKK